jgi:hypothetical protein
MLLFLFCIPGESRKEGLLYLYCDHFNSQGGEIIYNPDFSFISVILVQVMSMYYNPDFSFISVILVQVCPRVVFLLPGCQLHVDLCGGNLFTYTDNYNNISQLVTTIV